jgi:phage replication initiation protein
MSFDLKSSMVDGVDAPAEASACAATAGASEVPRVVTTGRKRPKRPPVDLYCGDAVERVAKPWGVRYELQPRANEAVRPDAAIIDALAFSIIPPNERSYTWVLKWLRRFCPFEGLEMKRGMFGFRHSALFSNGAGLIAWGGESQRGRVYVSLMGQGCSMVKRWAKFEFWLKRHGATIKRVDVAHDDFEGQRVNIQWAAEQYKGDGFSTGGRRPSHETAGDWLSGDAAIKGRTLYVGNRASGKLCRVYEKGKQLGDASSAWTRVEVEWHDQDRHIPYDILTRPGHYLAGAYPCLAFLSKEQSRIKTLTKGARIAFERALENAKQHCGKLVNLALEVFQGDYAEVVNRLIRPGYPGRMEPFSYHVARNPAMLDAHFQGAS